MIARSLRAALRGLIAYGFRSVLTLVGVLIGSAALIVAAALGRGASEKISGQIEGFAANALFIFPEATARSGARDSVTHLSEDDASALMRDVPSIWLAAGFLTSGVQVVAEGANAAATAYGTTLPYFDIRKYALARGELWQPLDETLKTRVCVLGATIADKLFETRDPVGEVVRVGTAPYRVVGVLKARGSSTFGEDQDARVFVPLGSFRARIRPAPFGRVDMILASVVSEAKMAAAQEEVTRVIRDRHHLRETEESDFRVGSQSDVRQTQRMITEVVGWLLLAISFVSLVVGGIGVTNVMLVGVLERTKEIGLRMALGAEPRDIAAQFLFESAFLGLVGGALGIAVGAAICALLRATVGWPLSPSSASVALALASSVAVGLVFGLLPARSASRLDPIEALRTE